MVAVSVGLDVRRQLWSLRKRLIQQSGIVPDRLALVDNQVTLAKPCLQRIIQKGTLSKTWNEGLVRAWREVSDGQTEERARTPGEDVLPPGFGGTAEDLARVDLQVKPKDTEPESFPMTHRCEGCGREVAFPEIFYTDKRCADCTDPYEVVRQMRRRKASMRVE